MKIKLYIIAICFGIAAFLSGILVADALSADYVDVVIETGNVKTARARLKNFGIHILIDDQGNLTTRPEEAAEHVMTPVSEDGTWSGTPPTWNGTGDYCFTIRMTAAQADKLPKNDTPNFSTSRTDEEGFEYPAYCPQIAR